MVKKPSKGILLQKCLKKIFLISGVICLLFLLGTFQVFSMSGSDIRASEDLPQKVVVTGAIVDARNNPMTGVNVLEKGTTNGVMASIDGKYSITVSSQKSILVFSFVGYEPQEVTVGTQAVVNVTLQESITGLNEVVVTGYGTSKRKDVTGSIASVKSDALMANSPTTIQRALLGKTAGVLIASGNLVNSSATIRVRGNRSVTATNDPLFVVDGIPSTGGMETLNPSDVESIEILKDASATAIYGSRGANGVIIVTTKKGQAGKVIVEYDGYYSLGYLNRFRKVFNVSEYVDYVREAGRKYTYDGNGGFAVDPTGVYGSLAPDYSEDMGMTYFTNDPYVKQSIDMAWVDGKYDPSKLRGFDWQMAGYRDYASSQNHSISIRGGSENTKVFVSGSYMNLQDIQLQSFRKRYTLRLNLDQNLGKWMTMGGNINFGYIDWNGGKGISTIFNPLGNPFYSPPGSNGLPDVTQTGDIKYGIIKNPAGEPLSTNPFFDLEGIKNQNRNQRLLTNLYLIVNPVKGLSYRANFGYNMNVTQNQHFASKYSTETNFGNPVAYQNFGFDYGWTMENILSYNKTLGSHTIGLTAVQSSEKFVQEPARATGSSLPMETQLWYSLGSASTQSATSSYTQWTMMSWLGRINYTYRDRYLLTASLRYDGSSRLATGQKWVAFPSAAIAWRLSEESFMKDISVIDNLKLRFGYGVTGNSAVAPYSTVGTTVASRYNFDKVTGYMGFAPNSLSNPNLTWEKTGQYNAGIDFSILKNRISGTIDYYYQSTYDLLMTRSLPTVSGFSSIVQNVGETLNKGLEISLNTVNIATSKFNWSTDLTFSTNKEEVTKLATGLPQDLVNNWFVGYPIDTYYGYIASPRVWGCSKEDMTELAKFNANGMNAKPGEIHLQDLNGDYKITDVDRKIIGSRMPKWSASLANTFKYGPFDLYMFLYGSFGQMIYWNPGTFIIGRYNSIKNDYWTPTNQDTKWLKPQLDIQMPANVDAMYYWDGDFLKISDITLGYTLPKILTEKAGIQNIRIYAKIQDPYMWTNFEGIDPEGSIAQTRSGGTIGTYNDAPFTMRTYMIGLNVTF
jgi:TonB-linked SusC/RagA family outer membrane protein